MKRKGMFWTALVSSVAFIILLVALLVIDRQPIGPKESMIGLATLNGWVFNSLGENLFWYDVTEYLGLFAFAAIGGVALLALCQWIKRKCLWKLDKDLYITAGFWGVMAAFYVLFEKVIINYRPVLEQGELAASFPSSHTMLVICVMWAAAVLAAVRIRHRGIRTAAVAVCILIMLVTAVGRLLSGVHWFTDILGGVLLSGALSAWYTWLVQTLGDK